MVTVEEEGGHTPFVIVHAKRFTPTPSEVTAVEKEEAVVNDAVPVTTDHRPVPEVGWLAESVAEVAQTVCEGPAKEPSGKF